MSAIDAGHREMHETFLRLQCDARNILPHIVAVQFQRAVAVGAPETDQLLRNQRGPEPKLQEQSESCAQNLQQTAQ